MAVKAQQEHEFAFIAGMQCVDFVNTLRGRLERPRELLRTYSDVVSWSVASGGLSEADAVTLRTLAKGDPTGAEMVVQRAVELREALFRILLAVARRVRPAPRDLDAFNRELEKASPHGRLLWQDGAPAFGWCGTPTLERPLWSVLRSTVELLVFDQRQRLKECEEQTCAWLFVDETRNRSRRWCDMGSCGNRAKARRFRARARKSTDD